MTRVTALVIALLLAAIGSVVVGAYVLLQRDRARLYEQFATERVRQVDEAGRAIAAELDDIGEDLRFAAELLAAPGSTSDHERELRALLQVVRQYQAIAVYGAEGPAQIFILDRGAAAKGLAPAALQALETTARRAVGVATGELRTSPPVSETGWIRAFSSPVPTTDGAPRAVAVLVDLERYFEPLRLISSEKDNHLLVLGAYGRPTPATDPRIASAVQRIDAGDNTFPALRALLEAMRKGERGTARIDRAEAVALGLEPAAVIAAFRPVTPRGAQGWSMGTLSSLSAPESLADAVTFRFGLAATAVVLLLGTFGAYVVVASRRVVALRESRRHAARLEHLHEKAQKILDNIPTGVAALSADGRISAANRILLDRMSQGCVGRTLQEALPAAPTPVVERVKALVDAACTDGEVRTIPGESLALFGEPGQYSLHAVPLEHPDPDVRALLVVEDLSSVHALESQLMRAEKLATVGMLAAGIAHEIGTPLGVVRGRAEYLLGKLGPESAQASSLKVVIDQIDRVSRTIRQLLDFSRIQPPQVQKVAVAQQIKAAEELLRLEADRRNLRLTSAVAEELPPLAADPDQLQQVLVNLVMNAFDASPPGSEVHLSAALEPRRGPALGGRVVLRVRDYGPGIPPDRLNQVFDPFFTTKKRGQGTGLGLSIVAQIARNHGAEVTLSSEPGSGTLVSVFWPTHPGENRNAVA